MGEGCLLFFVKNPKRGAVKTRLADALGEEVARDLYRTFILDMLSELQGVDYQLVVCYHPEDALDDIRELTGTGYSFEAQQGVDLGERMEKSMADALAGGFDRAVIIGSDVPDLPGAFIQESFAAFEAYDSVIGPAFDGGYYLIGFKRETFLSEVFQGIEWGTDRVLSRTLHIFGENQCTAYLLPPLRDIDTPEDLKAFFQKQDGTPNCPHTMAYLKESKLLSTKDDG